MQRVIDVRPSDGRQDFVRNATLDGVSIRLRLHWHPRTSVWTVQAFTPAEQPLSVTHTVQAGGFLAMDRRRADVPSGLLVWHGPDVYTYDDLGTALRLLYIDAPEPVTIPLADLLGAA